MRGFFQLGLQNEYARTLDHSRGYPFASTISATGRMVLPATHNMTGRPAWIASIPAGVGFQNETTAGTPSQSIRVTGSALQGNVF